MSQYSLKSFALLWMSILISSFLAFIYIILNLFFSDYITESSLKDLKYRAYNAQLKLSEQQAELTNNLVLHVTSPEVISSIEQEKFDNFLKLIDHWKLLSKIDRIHYYNAEGYLMDLKAGKPSTDGARLPAPIVKQLKLGYERVEYNAAKSGLEISIQRKIVGSDYKPLGYLVELKKTPYENFLEEGPLGDLIVNSSSGVVYTTPNLYAARQLSQEAFARGARAFELQLEDKKYDVLRLDIAAGITFFLVKTNLKEFVFQKFYEKYLLYFGLFILLLLLIFYLSYYLQVFKPLAQIVRFIVNKNPKEEFKIETSVFEINLIANKLKERISELNQNVVATKKGRTEDMSRLVASVAHELNNSLSYLGGNLEYLKDEITQEDGTENTELDLKEFKEALVSAQSGYERIKKIVSDLKVFSGKRDLFLKWHSLKTIKVKIDEEFPGLQFSFPEQFEHYEIKVDLERALQIIRNLILNAQQAYGEEGASSKILVSFYVDKHLFIEVKDWAGGIPKKVLKQIFEPFYTTKKNTGGAGLGLSLSQSLAEEMEASLLVKETSSEGTTFCFKVRHFRKKS